MNLEKGDRIEVVAVLDDPVPPAIGTRGVVVSVLNRGTEFEQVLVAWDRGPNGELRSLMLVPQDYPMIRKI